VTSPYLFPVACFPALRLVGPIVESHQANHALKKRGKEKHEREKKKGKGVHHKPVKLPSHLIRKKPVPSPGDKTRRKKKVKAIRGTSPLSIQS
jgi:hypothetical protein